MKATTAPEPEKKATAPAAEEPEKKAAEQTIDAAGNRMVRIKLFKDDRDYRDDVFVAVNGERYLIQRGVEVEVPAYVAEVLEHSASQDARTAELIQQIESEYRE